MQVYLDYLRHILDRGVNKQDRTGTGTRSIFGYQMRFDLTRGFPMVTTKFTPFKLIVGEMLWFLKGNQDKAGANDDLRELSGLSADKDTIWEEWKKPDSSFGPIYGVLWRRWPNVRLNEEPGTCLAIVNETNPTIDQIANLITGLKATPDSRRLIVSAWNVAAVESGEMALPPCHIMFQFYTRPMTYEQRLLAFDRLLWRRQQHISPHWEVWPEKARTHVLDDEGVPTRYLDCHMYQRSCDSFLGWGFNVAQYSLLTHMIGQIVNMEPGEFVWTGGDCHIYSNHFEQVRTLLQRKPKPLPKLWVSPWIKDIDGFEPNYLRVEGYAHCGKIGAPVAV